MSAMDKVKNVLHLNKDKDHTTTGTSHTTTHNNGVPEGTAGPHSSRVANAADPRVDSDLDSTRRTGAVGTGGLTGNSSTHTGPVVDHTGTGHTSTGVVGGHNTHTGTGVGHTGHSSNTTAGPHSSSLLNKVDPRVDSTTGYTSGTTGTTGHNSGLTGSSHNTHSSGFTGTGVHNTHNTGLTGSSHNTHNTGLTGTGTHNTHNTHNAGLTGTGTHGGISNSTNAGPHNSNIANKADPRVDSDLSGSGRGIGHSHGGLTGASGSHATPGSGTAQNTAGPHNSDLLNKLDPRVDADLDGSKTIGGNKTHA